MPFPSPGDLPDPGIEPGSLALQSDSLLTESPGKSPVSFFLCIDCLSLCHLASLVAQTVTNLPAMQETQVRSLGQGEPMEKEMATHSSILAWRILWTEKPGWLQSMGLQRVGHD